MASYLITPSNLMKELLSLCTEEKIKRLIENSGELTKCKMILDKQKLNDALADNPTEKELVNTRNPSTLIKLSCILGSRESISFLLKKDNL
jgi:predicted nucleic acid-binding protein